MEYRLLGPFQVIRDGQRVEIGTGMQRALLAALLLQPNQPVSTGRLIDAVWNDPPATAAKIVQNCVVRLRRLLPAESLLTRDRGYALRVAPGELDVDRFSHSLALGREAIHRGNYESALEHLDVALAEWTGAPLSDVGDQPFVEEEARRLDGIRVDAAMDRVDAALALGRHGEVITELERLVDERPLDERVRAQLMLALYRSGRQTESLRIYREGRRMLVDELGVEPAPALRQLEQQILRHDPAIDLPQPDPTLAGWLVKGRRRRVAYAGAALCFAAAFAVAAGIVRSGGAAPRVGTPPDSVAVVDPTTGRVAADLAVGTAPSSIAASSGSLWVANQGDESLTKIDAVRRRVSIASLQLTTNGDSSITGVAVANGGVWALDSYVGSLTRVPVTALAQHFAPGYDLYRALLPASDRYANDYLTLTSGGGHLWITSNHFSAVFELSPGSAQVQRTIAVPGHPVALTVAQGSIWTVATHGTSGVVAKIDPVAHAIVARIPVPGVPTALATGFGAVWVTVPNRDRLYEIDAATNAVIRTITVPGSPIAVAVGAGGIWIVEGTRRQLLRIDPASGAADMKIALNGTPHALAIARGRVWVVGA
jgi:DNA-binding SARP family transcriptional activator